MFLVGDTKSRSHSPIRSCKQHLRLLESVVPLYWKPNLGKNKVSLTELRSTHKSLIPPCWHYANGAIIFLIVRGSYVVMAGNV